MMCFQSQWFEPKNSAPAFCKRLSFSENFFKVKILKTFEAFTDCHIKTCRSLKRGAILKIPSRDFEKNLCSFYWLGNENSMKKRFQMLRQKPTHVLL